MNKHIKATHYLPCLLTSLFLATLTLLPGNAQEADPRLNMDINKNITYANIEGKDRFLDLYIPPDIPNPALIVWLHGGAWSRGSKEQMPLQSLVATGYAIASVDYRLSGEAPFPAQIHDIKAAIRFLRAMALDYGYRTDQIAIAGSSAGGHLAALVGTTNDHSELEGTLGDHLDQSSSVQAIVDFYGPTNFSTILSQSTPHGLSVRVPAFDLLLRNQPEVVPDLANLASPVTHVDSNDPPLLILHGDQDPQVPINQSHELHGTYQKTGLKSHFEVVYGAAHGGETFYDLIRLKIVQNFLGSALGE